jgi:hypothetical protein
MVARGFAPKKMIAVLPMKVFWSKGSGTGEKELEGVVIMG